MSTKTRLAVLPYTTQSTHKRNAPHIPRAKAQGFTARLIKMRGKAIQSPTELPFFLLLLSVLVTTREYVLRVSNAANLLELVLTQSDLGSFDVLFKVLDRSGAGNGQDRW